MASILERRSHLGRTLPFDDCEPKDSHHHRMADLAQNSRAELGKLALLTVSVRPLFWLFVVAFNLVGTADLVLNYYHAVQANLPAIAGELGATYAIPIIYVPLLMITHVAAFYMLMRPASRRTERATSAAHVDRALNG